MPDPTTVSDLCSTCRLRENAVQTDCEVFHKCWILARQVSGLRWPFVTITIDQFEFGEIRVSAARRRLENIFPRLVALYMFEKQLNGMFRKFT